MGHSINGKKVAILVTDGFEQVEMTEPRKALEEAGAQAAIVSPKKDSVRGWNHTDWGDTFPVDLPLQKASAADFDAILLPGGVMNPDSLRQDQSALEFIRHFVENGKPVAAICHGPWPLIEIDAVRGKRMTSYYSIKTDLINAGAEWIDAEVVTDHGLVTSRKPDDIPQFNAKMLEEISEGVHQRTSPFRGSAEARL